MSQEEKNVPVEQQRLEKEQIEDMGSVYRTRGAHAIHCLTVIILHDNEIVTGRTESRFQNIEMDRGHLRTKDRVIFSHFFGEYNAVEVGSNDRARQILFSADTKGSNQGTHTDAGST